MRSTIHKRSHLARGLRTQIVENKKPYNFSNALDMGRLCDINEEVYLWRLEATLNTISRNWT